MNRFPYTLKTILPFVIVVLALTVMMPRKGEFGYHYRKGSKWNYETLMAQFSFPILKTEEQMAQEKEKLGKTVLPYYNYSADVADEVADNVIALIPKNDILALKVNAAIREIYSKGVLPDIKTVNIDGVQIEEIPDVVFVQRDKRAQKVPKDELFTIHGAETALFRKLSADTLLNRRSLEAVFKNGQIEERLKPNLVFDRQLTEQVHQASVDFISPTSGVFQAGDIIVSSGEIITADIEQILDSYKKEYLDNIGYNGSTYLLLLGNLFVAFVLCSMVIWLLWFSRPETFSRLNEYLFVLTVFLISNLITFVFNKISSNAMLLVPYPVLALYYMAFFRKRLVIPLFILCLVPILVFCEGGAHLFVMYLFAGFVGVYTFFYFNRGWRQFIAAMTIFTAMTFVHLTEGLLTSTVTVFKPMDIWYLFVSAMACIAAYPLIYLFEILFNLVSANRLIELADTGNPLLRMLADKAPGTFQHSLSVMNMADAVAREIDGDIPLVRAAALYHDIGKTANPQCFVENQSTGVNYHEHLDLKESASEIIQHVRDGIDIAEKHGIPPVLREFISTHHGTTSTGYFHTRYLNEGGNPEDTASFFYPGPKPKTKEQVIIMLCDAVEAASRTLREFTPEHISSFVDKIYMEKNNAGQYDEADITMHELETVKETLKNYIIQVHHGRIAYPKQVKIK